ncbi:MAG TPA: MauE/DoxX family redox-associated membrane protein [Gaiellaceae bacterium]|nr:MauE/DoxX family redox-associated membrane protein [Gaiellaceae bacterium]
MGLLRFLLAAVLLASAAAKLAAGRSGREALRSYGLESARARDALWGAVIAVEAAVAIALAAGVPGAAGAAAILLGVFGLALAAAIRRGRAGAPCGCFGRSSRIGWPALARTAFLTAAAAALVFLPDTKPSIEAWLGIGLAVALVGLVAVAVGLLGLARELGELRLAVAPQAALSLDHEGPELGGRVGLIQRFDGRAPLAIAVFTSAGCALCRALEPSLRLVANDPEVELELFDEEADAEAWSSLAVPGSPYAVVLGRDGEVLAKGTFNSLFQLESLIAHATRPVGA